jgi:hypothetical protein
MEDAFVYVKLKRETVDAMISTYEFLVWNNNFGEERKHCKRVLKALKKSLK